MPKQPVSKADREYAQQIALRLYAVRKLRRLYQEDVALVADLPRTGVSKIETGDQLLQLHVFRHWCKALGVEPWQVLHPDWETLCRKD